MTGHVSPAVGRDIAAVVTAVAVAAFAVACWWTALGDR